MGIFFRRAWGFVLVMALLLTLGAGVAATEPEDTQTLITEATEPAETVPVETEPEETLPAVEIGDMDTETVLYDALAALEPELKCDQIFVFDATTGQMLYKRTTEGDKLYPASITKLFSAYVALQYLDEYEVITAGEELSLVKPGSSVAYIGRGHQLYASTVVEAMMLPSGNDAAMVLAAAAGKRIAGDDTISAAEAVQVFVAKMNEMAKQLGFEKSHFANPDGFHIGCHYTCLNDMARIAKLALENKTIARYIRRYQDDVTFVSGQTIEWKNTNLLLNPEDGFYRGDAIGMKTGYTRQAEYCLMSAFKCSNGRTIVVGAFGSDDEFDRLRDILKLINTYQEQIKLGNVQ